MWQRHIKYSMLNRVNEKEYYSQSCFTDYITSRLGKTIFNAKGFRLSIPNLWLRTVTN